MYNNSPNFCLDKFSPILPLALIGEFLLVNFLSHVKDSTKDMVTTTTTLTKNHSTIILLFCNAGLAKFCLVEISGHIL